MINQNTTISQQLTLWNQNGSRVIRGKQIVTPIENSFLYVVPLYLTAAATDFPQLKRVIAIAGDKVVMEPTLDEAIAALFGSKPPALAGAHAQSAAAGGARVDSDAVGGFAEARTHLEDAQEASGQGDWTKFGDAMDKLKALLNAQQPPVQK